MSDTGMPAYSPTSLRTNARVLMPTWRQFSKHAFRSGMYEAQDVFANVDEVDLLHVESGPRWQLWEKLLRRLLWRDVSRKLIYMNPGLKPVHLQQDYELLVVFCSQPYELLYLNAIKEWRDHCGVAVCWFDEFYVADIPNYRYWLTILNQFDHVMVSQARTADALRLVLHRPCHYVPHGIDVLRFSPYPVLPDRVIDVLSIGRKYDGIHRALLQSSGTEEIFYVHDTVMDAGDMRLKDAKEHRNLLANMIKRSQFFTVAPGKIHEFQQTRGQMVAGMRYFEGAAAGAVLLGEAPENDTFHTLFDWPQAVIPVRPDGTDTLDVIRGLQREPDLLHEISERNALNTARRHDWMHRWQTILDIAGLPALSRLNARGERLQAIADHGMPTLPRIATQETPRIAHR